MLPIEFFYFFFSNKLFVYKCTNWILYNKVNSFSCFFFLKYLFNNINFMLPRTRKAQAGNIAELAELAALRKEEKHKLRLMELEYEIKYREDEQRSLMIKTYMLWFYVFNLFYVFGDSWRMSLHWKNDKKRKGCVQKDMLLSKVIIFLPFFFPWIQLDISLH